jgi:hypothetical protein
MPVSKILSRFSLSALLALAACGGSSGSDDGGNHPDAGTDAGPNPLAITGLQTETWTWVPIRAPSAATARPPASAST